MLEAMHFFDQVARDYHEQKQPEKAAKYMAAAVKVAEKVAPYIHARLMAIESRGDNVDQRAPFVIRAPAVMADSSTWQAAVGSAVIEMEAAGNGSPVRQSDVAATPPGPDATKRTSDRASSIDGRSEQPGGLRSCRLARGWFSRAARKSGSIASRRRDDCSERCRHYAHAV